MCSYNTPEDLIPNPLSKTNIFQFKQFGIDQTGCAMKVNTDGVLLGALVTAADPRSVLDIGTGTGVIALMLAQRFSGASVDAVEIDESAACMAAANFKNSSFKDRCSYYFTSFQHYLTTYPGKKYDLIVSNPPFFINSLKSSEKPKEVARHTTMSFFTDLLATSSASLNENGKLWLILPVETADAIVLTAGGCNLWLHEQITVASFPSSEPHRKVICLGHQKMNVLQREFAIYSGPGVYSKQYATLLKDFLTIF